VVRNSQRPAGRPASSHRPDPSGRSEHVTASHAKSRISNGSAKIIDFDRLSARRHGSHGTTRMPQTARLAASRPTSAGRRSVRSEADQEASAQRAPRPSVRREETAHSSRTADLQRSWRRRKADRLFSQQEPDSNDVDDEGPRPGLYKGEMGRSQRKSARMQDQESNSGSRFPWARGLSKGWRNASRSLRIGAIVCCCLVLSFAFVYPSAKDAYAAVRDQQQAQAEYEAVLNRNDEIQDRIDLLKTDEGMANYARDEYGYVKSGETSVLVSGLDSCDIAADAENQTAAIASGSVKAPDTWYSPFLDTLFGYSSGSSSS
jgi:cell division protein FtsB